MVCFCRRSSFLHEYRVGFLPYRVFFLFHHANFVANAHFRSRHALFLPTCRGGDTLLWILDDFGRSLAAFASDLGTTDVGTLSSAAAIIETLVTLAASAAGINSDNIGTIGTILEEFGELT